MTFEEEFEKDEADIRDLVERVRKDPVLKRPRLIDWQDWDVYCLMAKSYNRHNLNRDKVDVKEGFHDKRFEKFLGDDY